MKKWGAKATPPARSLFVVNANNLRPYLGPPLKFWITFHPPCLPNDPNVSGGDDEQRFAEDVKSTPIERRRCLLLTFGQKQQGRGEIYGGKEGTNCPQRKVPPSCTVLLKPGRIVGTQRDRNVSRS